MKNAMFSKLELFIIYYQLQASHAGKKNSEIVNFIQKSKQKILQVVETQMQLLDQRDQRDQCPSAQKNGPLSQNMTKVYERVLPWHEQ